jgi:hypothetical protein
MAAACGVLVKEWKAMEVNGVLDGSGDMVRVREMRETEGPALRERFVEEAAAIGVTIEELVQLGTKRRGRPPREKEED